MPEQDDRLERFERATELPMLTLALAIIPLLILPEVADLTPAQTRAVIAVDWFVWAVFAVELGVRTYLAPRRWAFLRGHWYDVAFVALPFLRPLRIIRAGRLLRLSRTAAVLTRTTGDARRIAGRDSIRYALVAAVIACLLIAVAVTFAERDANDATIADLADGLWWAVTTVTTVGYGDLAPVTPLGRGLAFALMLVGIGAFGVMTASVAAYFVESEEPDVSVQLDRIEERLDRIERALTTAVRD